ncbi:flagellar type III secretion system protein FlhA [Altererythrobacter xixiisoli]|uniref:Flagellar type III secretion system protein FlhA n=1 Tax=Croceibacterium xixiisoli TaxID=1476466 RepID=A0A6I4TQN5_9SPHN|nr:flagellar biosynthesis protein FlhA [Croceibacterium xixiisoli]MXO98485.1 flagellar type III secretion system protein FlhA [Croceibacterium xixiisoli]
MRSFLNPALALPFGILTIIVLMVVPIPTVMLDVFFVLNIALSVAVLMAAMNAAKPLDFSSFPSVLLFATLLRLALNVASTRVVLMNGHEGEEAAGMVIEAFGAFLIGGDFAVGIFVFLILMIINLMVVTKGAGRVSEVSARFTLDALPGKQMAIDADLAAGLMTADEAKARRREIATEADFYGSMDGASKFVKGDAVAALLILMVNIIGGLVLGIVSHGLSVAEAGHLYVTLAVGDALVASVPALLLSIAAAIIVTRVSDTRDLTGQIGGQFADPRIWLPVGCIMGAMGMIPAMPQTIFLPLAAGALFLWRTLRKRQQAVLDTPEPEIRPDPSIIDIRDVSEQSLVTIELGYGLVHLADERRGAPLVVRLTGLRRQLSQTLGFVVPQFRLRDSFDLPPDRYRILLGGAPLAIGQLRPDRLLAIDAGEVRNTAVLPGEATVDPSFGCPALWIDQGTRDLAVAEGYLVVDAESVVATHINQLLAARAHELLGPDQVRDLLDTLRDRHAQLIETITPAPLSLATITRLFRALLADGVSLAHPLPVLSSLSLAAQQTTDHERMVDLMRADLGAMIVGSICPPDERLPVITLAAELEEMVVNGMMDPTTGQIIIEPDLARSIGERIAAIFGMREPGSIPPVLIVQPRARRPLAALLRLRAPLCAVISINELPASQPVEVIAVVGGESEPAEAPAFDAPDYAHEREAMAA